MTIALMIASAVTGYGAARILQSPGQLVLGVMAFLTIGFLKLFGATP